MTSLYVVPHTLLKCEYEERSLGMRTMSCAFPFEALEMRICYFYSKVYLSNNSWLDVMNGFEKEMNHSLEVIKYLLNMLCGLALCYTPRGK